MPLDSTLFFGDAQVRDMFVCARATYTLIGRAENLSRSTIFSDEDDERQSKYLLES
jgi:hypothetical protein